MTGEIASLFSNFYISAAAYACVLVKVSNRGSVTGEIASLFSNFYISVVAYACVLVTVSEEV